MKVEPKDTGIFNKDLYRFKEGLIKLDNIDCSAELSLLIIKNKRLAINEIEDFEKIIKPTEDYINKYQVKVEEVANKYCVKDKDGKPLPRISPNGSAMYDFAPDDKIIFDKEVLVLEEKEENKVIIEERKKQVNKYNALMELPCDVPFKKIPARILPENIKPSQIDLIFELIED